MSQRFVDVGIYREQWFQPTGARYHYVEWDLDFGGLTLLQRMRDFLAYQLAGGRYLIPEPLQLRTHSGVVARRGSRSRAQTSCSGTPRLPAAGDAAAKTEWPNSAGLLDLASHNERGRLLRQESPSTEAFHARCLSAVSRWAPLLLAVRGRPHGCQGFRPAPRSNALQPLAKKHFGGVAQLVRAAAS